MDNYPSFPIIVPGASSFLFRRGKLGCLLVHGYTCSAEEMLPLGQYLAKCGYSVFGVRLAGHGTHPTDMNRSRYTDWLASIEDGYNLLKGMTEQVILIGQSLGAMLVLAITPYLPVTATVAISTPFIRFSFARKVENRLLYIIKPLMRKPNFRNHKITNNRREPKYPAYPLTPMRSILETEHVQQAMVDSLPKIKTPLLLLQSQKDLSPDTVSKITSLLTLKQYGSIWYPDLDHSMVLDKKRDLVFRDICNFISQFELPRGKR